ncbi:phosphotransacetylase [Fodinisporobacter ferrooxydans]|uniref:Phosphotransacetylase n=1 Tax=Fodinisporobacter ferrooxydans TaxID=2901836 RepID=A0ABY4CHX0_9BACL|nr:phosphotransacetylase [Alicyclobacillaceae bacterium MYW30-H2]
MQNQHWTPKLEQLRQQAFRLEHRIVITDGDDERALNAIEKISSGRETCSLHFILLGDETRIHRRLHSLPVSVTVRDPIQDPELTQFAELYRERCFRRGKLVPSLDEAVKRMSRAEYFGAALVAIGQAEGMVGGSSIPTGHVLKAGLEVVGLHQESKLVSGAFIMMLPHSLPGGQDMLVFADCAVVPDPNSEQLSAIALDASKLAQIVAGLSPVVAFLSFSTKGSAEHLVLDKIRKSVEIIRQRQPNLIVDGELQADAALIPDIANRKAPQSLVRGQANVLIFPDLNAGNIGYKLVERLANAKALGVILSGFAKPINDLSRGCSAEDIVDMVCVTALQAEKR